MANATPLDIFWTITGLVTFCTAIFMIGYMLGQEKGKRKASREWEIFLCNKNLGHFKPVGNDVVFKLEEPNSV